MLFLSEISKCRIFPAAIAFSTVAIATSVFVLAVTAAFGAAIHTLSTEPVGSVMAWSIPGVLLGSTTGSRVGKYLPAKVMGKGLGIMFAGLGWLILVGEFLF